MFVIKYCTDAAAEISISRNLAPGPVQGVRESALIKNMQKFIAH